MELSATRIGEPTKRDRLLRSNTSNSRTHSLFRQGCMALARIIHQSWRTL
jgi:hypothetical protein